jgi:hypothetical protein
VTNFFILASVTFIRSMTKVSVVFATFGICLDRSYIMFSRIVSVTGFSPLSFSSSASNASEETFLSFLLLPFLYLFRGSRSPTAESTDPMLGPLYPFSLLCLPGVIGLGGTDPGIPAWNLPPLCFFLEPLASFSVPGSPDTSSSESLSASILLATSFNSLSR